MLAGEPPGVILSSEAPLRDPARLAALAETGLLDSPAEESFDRLTRLVARLLDAPVALVSLVDSSRQFFKSAQGLPEPWATKRETPLSHSFCQYVIRTGDALVVEDAPEHPVVCTNLAVTELGVAAYLGVPLTTPEGQVLGSLCAIDSKPRAWTGDDISTMRDVAEIVMREVALRREIVRRKHAEEQQNLLIGELHHRVKNTLAVVQSLVSLSLRSADNFETFGHSITTRIASLAKTHTLLVDRQWHAVSLRDLLASEYGPYAEGARIALDGPEVSLPSQIAVGLGMALHELITNAIKYGSLSKPNGRVSLKWDIHQADDGMHLHLDWTERDGPLVTPPSRRGFGTVLLERLLAPQLDGKIVTDFAPEGLRVRIEALVSPTPRA